MIKKDARINKSSSWCIVYFAFLFSALSYEILGSSDRPLEIMKRKKNTLWCSLHRPCFEQWAINKAFFFNFRMLLNVNVTLLVPLWLSSLVIGRLGLWPIRRIVCQASTQPAESVAFSASPARVSSNHVDWHRLSASPALTVSSKKKKKLTYHLNTIYIADIWRSCLHLCVWCVKEQSGL